MILTFDSIVHSYWHKIMNITPVLYASYIMLLVEGRCPIASNPAKDSAFKQ